MTMPASRSRCSRRPPAARWSTRPTGRCAARILDNVWPPGHRALEQELALELGMSRTPVREALIRLQRTKAWSRSIPRHGMRVLPVSADRHARDLPDADGARVRWPPSCVAQRKPTDAELKPLVAASRDDGRGAQGRRPRRVGRGRRALPPRTWSSSSGNRLLVDAVQNCWDRAHRARMFTLRLRPKPVALDPRAHGRRASGSAPAMRRGASTSHRAHRERGSRELLAILEHYRLAQPVRLMTMSQAPRYSTSAVLPGDGIGPEVIDATLPLLEQLARGAPYALRVSRRIRPARSTTRRPARRCRTRRSRPRARADAILFGAMGWPEIRYPDGTEIAPQLDLRVELELYAGVRPARAHSRASPLPLADPRAATSTSSLVRESTEGLFASRGRGVVDDDREARDTMVITRARVASACTTSPSGSPQRRKRARPPGRVTCVDKANVFVSMAFFRKIFDERAPRVSRHRGAPPLRRCDRARPGAQALGLRRAGHREHVRRHPVRPDARRSSAAWAWRRRPTSATAHALFQPCHGSAPDIAGQGKANPDRDDPVGRA